MVAQGVSFLPTPPNCKLKKVVILVGLTSCELKRNFEYKNTECISDCKFLWSLVLLLSVTSEFGFRLFEDQVTKQQSPINLELHEHVVKNCESVSNPINFELKRKFQLNFLIFLNSIC